MLLENGTVRRRPQMMHRDPAAWSPKPAVKSAKASSKWHVSQFFSLRLSIPRGLDLFTAFVWKAAKSRRLSYICIQCAEAMPEKVFSFYGRVAPRPQTSWERFIRWKMGQWWRQSERHRVPTNGTTQQRHLESVSRDSERIMGRSASDTKDSALLLVVIFLTRFAVILILVREGKAGTHNKPSGMRFRVWFVTIHDQSGEGL